MNIFYFLKSLFAKPAPEIFTGALLDDRRGLEQLNDIHFDEIVTAADPVNWRPLDTAKLPDWPVLNQNGAGACVAFTKALMASILYFTRKGIWVLFSPKWIYIARKNYPSAGMYGYDAFDIEATEGLVPEDMVPSQNLTEEQINNYSAEPWEKEVGKALRMSDQKVVLPVKDIDTVASVMQTTGKPVMVWFEFFYDEWTATPQAIRANPSLRHSVTFIPPKSSGQNSFGLYNGKKAIVIQDSWGLDRQTFNGKRIIDEDFYKTRNFFAAYSMRFKFDEGQRSKPVYDGTIVSLQKCLRYEGCFPTNIDFVESFGPVTKKSLAQFQQKYGLPASGQLDAATLAKIKAMFV